MNQKDVIKKTLAKEVIRIVHKSTVMLTIILSEITFTGT
jgi:hypothetical protein